MSGALRPGGLRPGLPAREDRLAVFLRGLVIGAFVGAILAGAAALRRARRR
ncbi:MAG: hypothetical protein ABIG85_00450 [Chloroflexota bacterium]